MIIISLTVNNKETQLKLFTFRSISRKGGVHFYATINEQMNSKEPKCWIYLPLAQSPDDKTPSNDKTTSKKLPRIKNLNQFMDFLTQPIPPDKIKEIKAKKYWGDILNKLLTITDEVPKEGEAGFLKGKAIVIISPKKFFGPHANLESCITKITKLLSPVQLKKVHEDDENEVLNYLKQTLFSSSPKRSRLSFETDLNYPMETTHPPTPDEIDLTLLDKPPDLTISTKKRKANISFDSHWLPIEDICLLSINFFIENEISVALNRERPSDSVFYVLCSGSLIVKAASPYAPPHHGALDRDLATP